jgi:acetyl-CoA carboxylase biotin carboxyl carrier protein
VGWNIDREQLVSLLETLAAHDVAELEFEDEEVRLRIVRGRVVAAGPVASVPAAPAAAAATSADADADAVFVTSPFVGTFYRAPAPDLPPFVDVGARVTPGQTLCIVEAMKLMNEIEAEVAGTVVEVLVETGKPVEYGQKLFRLRRG